MSEARADVLAVVVATNGADTLPRTLAALAAQDHDGLGVVAVDNGSTDDSRDVLLDHLRPEQVLVADRDLGFGGAVAMALDAEISRGAPYVLLVHDDLELRPDAVSHLVGALERDDQLAVVGTKLVEWDDPTQLQAVGMTVDVTGRADPGVEPDELDQGQRDHEDRTLYVSTAGMMVRRDRFEELGRFDHRYHLFRDDLDLCWRAWLRGWSVEVVPDAVGAHEASASTYRRLGQTAFLGPRYFAERNTLASLLKNYGPVRLLFVVPLFLLVGAAKVLGFVATRRLGDAWQTLRAWAWNVVHLRETRRLRRRVQANRVRADKELKPLFAQVTARVRAYSEALGEILSGGSDEIALMEEDAPSLPDPTLTERVRTTLRTRPIAVAAGLLAVLGIVVAIPLVGRTTLVGGELAAWPDQVWALAVGYAQPWTVGDLPAVARVDPAQALLTLVSAVTGGSVWLAPRLVLLAIVPVAWASALWAGRLVTDRRLPRVAGATLYALSPPLLAALRTGRIGAAAAAALLPLFTVAVGRAVLPGTPADRAWRATAAAALAAAAVIAFEPATIVLLPLVVLAAAVMVVAGRRTSVRSRLLRLVLVVLGAGLVLAPWLPTLRTGWVRSPDVDVPTVGRLLLLAPDIVGFPTALAGAGLAAAVLLGVALSGRRAGQAAGLAAVYLGGVAVAWGVFRGVVPGVWAGTPLLVAALAAAGLLVLAFTLAQRRLATHDFGWRQLATAVTAGLVVVGVVVAGGAIVQQPWQRYEPAGSVLPAFLASEPEVDGIGPFRVLVLGEEGDRAVWSITDADGPTMASWGHVVDGEVVAELDGTVRSLTRGQDPAAAAALGYAGIRYVVVPPGGLTAELERPLREQLDLVDQPVTDGLVLRVTTWLPRWSVLPPDAADQLAVGRPLPAGVEASPAAPGETIDGGLLVLADPVGEQPAWQVTVDGEPVAVQMRGGVATWEVSAGALEVTRRGATMRYVLVGVQAFVTALACSLALRAPRFARRRAVGGGS